jgi:hypothetical protein
MAVIADYKTADYFSVYRSHWASIANRLWYIITSVMAVLLENLEGYRPWATVSALDTYRLAHSEEEAASAVTAAGLPIDSEEFGQLADKERAEIRRIQGVAEYVGGLAMRLGDAMSERKTLAANSLAATGLTRLFEESYGVDMAALTKGLPILRLFCWPPEPRKGLGRGFEFRYQVIRQEGGADTFWEVEASATYGFVNFYGGAPPHKPTLPVPLIGSGNIAFMAGVREALEEDVETLVSASR